MDKNEDQTRRQPPAPSPERRTPESPPKSPRPSATPADMPRKRQRRFGHN